MGFNGAVEIELLATCYIDPPASVSASALNLHGVVGRKGRSFAKSRSQRIDAHACTAISQ